MSQTESSNEIIEEVARCVAFIVRHCGLPVHRSCIRRLLPEVFSPQLAVETLLRAGQLLQLQQKALLIGAAGTKNNIFSSGSPVKLNQEGHQNHQTSNDDMGVFGFFQSFDHHHRHLHDSSCCFFSSSIQTRLVEMPLQLEETQSPKKQHQQHHQKKKKEEEVINLLTLPPVKQHSQKTFGGEARDGDDDDSSLALLGGDSSCRIISSQVSVAVSSVSEKALSIRTLAGLWMADRGVLEVDSTLSSAVLLQALDPTRRQEEDDGKKSHHGLADALLCCAWRIDLKAMMIRVGFESTVKRLHDATRVQRQLNAVAKKSTLPSSPSKMSDVVGTVDHLIITRRVSSSQDENSNNGSLLLAAAEEDKNTLKCISSLPYLSTVPRDGWRFTPVLDGGNKCGAGGRPPAAPASGGGGVFTPNKNNNRNRQQQPPPLPHHYAVGGDDDDDDADDPIFCRTPTTVAHQHHHHQQQQQQQQQQRGHHHLTETAKVVASHKSDPASRDWFFLPRRRLRE